MHSLFSILAVPLIFSRFAMSGTPSVPASPDLTSREGSLEETNSQDNHLLEPEHRDSQTRLSQPEMSNGDTATNYLNGHVNGLSTNVNQNYFLQSPPSNYCQNGPSANRLSSAQCSNATGTSNLLSQCQTAEGCLSTTASCQLNFCAHCSKLSPNHIALSAPSNLIGQQSSQHSHQNPGSHHDLNNSGYSSSGMINSFAGGSNFQVPGGLNAQCSKHGTTGHVMNGMNGDVANGGGVGQCSCDWVDLNVGGKLFKTTKMTLSKVPGSFLDCLCNNQNLISSHLDQNGMFSVFFKWILAFLASSHKQKIKEANRHPACWIVRYFEPYCSNHLRSWRELVFIFFMQFRFLL